MIRLGEGKVDPGKIKIGGTIMERELETAFITFHAQMRMKERLGIKNLDRMIRMASLALDRGIRIENAKDSIAKQMMKHDVSDGKEIVLYSGYYYVFTEDFGALVTVFPAGKKETKWTEAAVSKSNGFKKYNFIKDIRSAFEEELRFA